MVKQFLLIIGFLCSIQVMSQTGIGTTTPHVSAKLDVTSTNKGFLPPRVTLSSVTDATTIPTPATGLLVYNLGSEGLKAGYYYWNGSNWATIATASSPDQTLDYVSVQSSGQTVVTGNTIMYNTTLSGNIPYNSSTGNFSLIAGKTYRLTAYATLDVSSSAGAELNFVWRNAANAELGNYALLLAANSTITAAGQGIVDVIYTPTTNTTVSVYVNWAGGTVALRGGYTYATIQQIGSSATINPWTLSGTNTYNTTGNVGIGSSSPSASALLDVSSSSKGILIPRMTASQKNAIASPTTGLLIFQTDAPSDFYYYNGSSWMSLREPTWTSAGTIQSVGWNATTTAPTIGTTTVNDYSYKQIGAKTWQCQLIYSAPSNSSGNNGGSGDYLFTLPSGLQFNTSIVGQAINVDNVGTSSWIWPSLWLSNSTGTITNSGQAGLLYVVPYSSTQFRLIHVGIAGIGYVIPYGSGYYSVGANVSWRVTFTFQSL